MQISDIREILTYIPRFRERVFVLALDGEMVAHDNFANLLLDFALLRSLNIKVVIVHGAALQIEAEAARRGVDINDADGTGVTDAETLDVAATASAGVTRHILESLASVDLRACETNALTAHPAGILGGVDHLFTGKIERVDTDFLNHLLERGIIPVVSPISYDHSGGVYRCNSDNVATAVAEALESAKLMFLCRYPGLEQQGRLVSGLSIEEAKKLLGKNRNSYPPPLRTKIEYCLRACTNGVNRAHIIDGTADAAVINEVFSNEGIGTMIHANEYQQIRRARRKDVRAIYRLIQEGVAKKEIVSRPMSQIERDIKHFHVFETDKNIVGCVALQELSGAKGLGELSCLCVHRGHENMGIGRDLVAYLEEVAAEQGLTKLLAFSTQTYNFFVTKAGFEEASPEVLPAVRRKEYNRAARKSKVLVKELDG
ncbi:MAG: amino-acid N-acetyltransferase [Verrucomicrobiota bacterium]